MKAGDVSLLWSPSTVRLHDDAPTTDTACCGFLHYALWIPLGHVTTQLSPRIQSVSGSNLEKDINEIQYKEPRMSSVFESPMIAWVRGRGPPGKHTTARDAADIFNATDL